MGLGFEPWLACLEAREELLLVVWRMAVDGTEKVIGKDKVKLLPSQ